MTKLEEIIERAFPHDLQCGVRYGSTDHIPASKAACDCNTQYDREACRRAVRESWELLAQIAESEQWILTEKGKRKSVQVAQGIREIAAAMLEDK